MVWIHVDPKKYGEKIEILEKQLGEISSLLQYVVDVVGRQQREGGESFVSVAAPGGTGPEAGTHRTDATPAVSVCIADVSSSTLISRHLLLPVCLPPSSSTRLSLSHRTIACSTSSGTM